MSDGGALVDAFREVEPREFVLVPGYPESGDESRWHVNKAIMIGSAESQRKAVVLQRADASEEWIVAILKTTNDGWEFDSLAAFEGDPPKGLGASDHGESLDPASLSVSPAPEDAE